MVIQHNMLAWNANRQYKINTDKSKKITEKLSSGYKINRAADDAAGLAISEKMRRQIRGLNKAAENIQDGIGYVQTADGALNEVHDMLQRMNELAVKAANGTLTEEDREYIDSEVQQLKSEMDRVFSTTTFNEERIWDPDDTQKLVIGTERRQAAEFVNRGNYNTAVASTNVNCDVLADPILSNGGYQIIAEDDGVKVKWTAYDGNDYETEKLSWADFEAAKYEFKMADNFKEVSDGINKNLYDKDGNPVFDFSFKLNVQDTATVEDIKQSINNCYVQPSPSASMSGKFEDSGATANGYKEDNKVSIVNVSVDYNALYASNAKGTEKEVDLDSDGVVDDKYGYNFDAEDDTFLEAMDKNGNKLTSGTGTNLVSYPKVTDAAVAGSSDATWKFTFKMDGVGNVTANSTSVRYWANSDSEEDDKGIWWEWDSYVSNGKTVWYKDITERTVASGTLGTVMSVLTGEKGVDTATPGLLNESNADADGKGAANGGGYLEINFQLTADTDYRTDYDNVGSFSVRVQVLSTDTEQDVLDRINNALNNATIVDFQGYNQEQHYVYNPYANTKIIDVPIYGGTNSFYVQAGVESGQHISVDYDCLSVLALGMKDTNVKTIKDSEKAINEIKSALQAVSKQRADFGAYQNRLEHAYNANKNTEENTTASESVIRDTDMAALMVQHSNQNILLQAGQAMLAQANQANQSVLALLS